MQLIELSLPNKENYNRFVASQQAGSFLQAWEWGQWQESLGKPAARFFLTDDFRRVIASLQIIKSPLPLGKYYLYAPYGPAVAGGGNFKFQISNFKFLARELQKKFSAAVFMRLEPKADIGGLARIGRKSVNIQPGKTLVLTLEKSSDELLADMHPKTRYNIRLAERHGVQIVSDLMVVPGHGLYIQEVLDLIMGTSERQTFQTFSRDYYQKLLDFFALRNRQGELKVYIYKALLDRELLSAAIMVDFGRTRTYLFGGSSEHHREAMAPHLLHFGAMLDAQKLGLKFYDFWGVETAGGETPGFVRFKLGFGGEIISYAGAWDVPNNKLWYHGYKTLRRVNRMWLYIKTFRKA